MGHDIKELNLVNWVILIISWQQGVWIKSCWRAMGCSNAYRKNLCCFFREAIANSQFLYTAGLGFFSTRQRLDHHIFWIVKLMIAYRLLFSHCFQQSLFMFIIHSHVICQWCSYFILISCYTPTHDLVCLPTAYIVTEFLLWTQVCTYCEVL